MRDLGTVRDPGGPSGTTRVRVRGEPGAWKQEAGVTSGNAGDPEEPEEVRNGFSPRASVQNTAPSTRFSL